MKLEIVMNEDDKNKLSEEEFYLKSIACGYCPKCSRGFLVARKNSSNKELFLGCSSFPSTECNFTINVEDFLDVATNYRVAHFNELAKLNTSENLFRNAEEAFISSIEIYNKPLFMYKFQSCIILLINAWELLMKAIVCNKNGDIAIMSDDEHTITFGDCIAEILKIDNSLISPSLKENLSILYDIRNNYTHFYCQNTDTLFYSLISKAVDEFIKLFGKYYTFKSKEILSMQYLPICFNINKTTIQELKEIRESKDSFIKSIADRIINFANQNKEMDSILYNVDINLQTIKNIKNADIIIGLDKNSKYTIDLEKKVKLGNKNDNSLQKVSLSDEQINEMYPYLYADLMQLTKGKGNYKIIQEYIKSVKNLDNCQEYCYEKNKHPKRKSGSYYIYSQKCYDEILNLSKNKQE